MDIKDKKGTENLVVDHLSQLEGPREEVQVNDNFQDEQLLAIADTVDSMVYRLCELLSG